MENLQKQVKQLEAAREAISEVISESLTKGVYPEDKIPVVYKLDTQIKRIKVLIRKCVRAHASDVTMRNFRRNNENGIFFNHEEIYANKPPVAINL